jgi:uncharacterized protein YbcI
MPDAYHRSAAEAVSTAIALAYKEHYGRGPNLMYTRFAGPDVLTCVLEGSMSPAQAKLLELGRHDIVHDARSALQEGHGPQLRAIVEEVTGRRVRTLVSGLNVAEDVAVETFLLYPAEAA